MSAGGDDHDAICLELLIHRRRRPPSVVFATILVDNGLMGTVWFLRDFF